MSPLTAVRQFISSHTEMSSVRSGGNAQTYPAVPPTLNAGDYELRDYSVECPEYDSLPNTNPKYTPYLGLRARLSQVWINKWTILLLLVLCRVLLAIKNLNQNIDNAKAEALSACSSVESVGSAMASMPHYMSQGVNVMAADGITNAFNALMTMVMMSVTAVEEIILFVINMYISTYMCLITLVVDGSLHAAITLIEETGAFMNKSIASITSTMTNDINAFQSDMNSFLSAIGSITSVLGGSKTPPKLDISLNVASLNSIQIDPTTMDANLNNLANNLPSFAQVQNLTNHVIQLPFEEVKKLVNESMSSYTFDRSIFPVAQKQALTFCSDNQGVSDFFNGLTELADLARKVFIAVMLILAVLACVPMAYREIWKWRSLQQRAQLVQKSSFDPLDVIYIASRPYTSTAGIKIGSKFKMTKRQILTRWAVAYATSVPALFILALGVAGLFSALCQYILLRSIQHEVPVIANEVGGFADTVVHALQNASTAWAVSTNAVINSTNTKVNQDVFGWVNTTTTAVNGTLNFFVDEVTDLLNITFGNTILYTPIMDTLNCLVGLKINSIEKGLTWVSDHAYVTFPEFNEDVFSLGAASSISNSSSADTFLSSPGSVASDDITAAVVKLTDLIAAGIYDEFLIAAALVGAWVLVALIGVTRALIGFWARDKTRAEGGPTYTGEQATQLPPQGPHATNFPAFDAHSAGGLDSSEQVATWPMPDPANERVHLAGRRMPTFEKGHVRESSYGYVADVKR